MSGRPGDWLVIPAYNEGQVIASTLHDALAYFENVVVVDDCSNDDTRAIAAQAGAHVCRHPINLGQGAALQLGIDYALAQGADRIVTFDADGQHRPIDAISMLETLEREGCDVVLGSASLAKRRGFRSASAAFFSSQPGTQGSRQACRLLTRQRPSCLKSPRGNDDTYRAEPDGACLRDP